MLSQRTLSFRQLTLVASGDHDDATLAELCGAERSRRLLALRVLLRQARAAPAATGPLAPVSEAWDLLVRAQRKAPRVVSEILSQPQLGVWAAHTLRRLRNKTDDAAPLWFHVGQFHATASAAAIRAGLRFRLSIPLWDGVAVLPTLGSVRLPASPGWTRAEVVADPTGCRVGNSSGTVTIDSRPPHPGWHPHRLLRGGPTERDLVLRLDDTGPYRGLEIPSPPEPLSLPAVGRWEELVAGAWRLLDSDHERRARELSVGLSIVVPRPANARFRQHSASAGDGFGAAIISEPYDPAQLVVTLVHEFQHSKLNAVDHLVRLADDDPTLDCYSPWRDDPRPTMGLYHGVFAFTAVAEFWATHRERVTGRERELADFEYALLRLQLAAAVQDLAGRSSLTEAGRHFLAGVRDRIAALSPVEVSPEAVDAARLAALDHRLSWRVSHLRPDSEVLRRAADAWRRRRPPPSALPEPTVQPNGQSARLDVKAMVTKVLLADPAGFVAARSELDTAVQVATDAGAADFALVEGNAAEARDLYVAELAGGSDRPGAWSGLGLALAAIASGGRAAMALLRRPELVSAVSHEVTATTGAIPHPEELAAWLGPPT